MSKIWVLTADASRARLFEAKTPKAPLIELVDFVEPEARAKGTALLSDRPGSDGGGAGYGRHVLDDETPVQEAAAKDFARLVARQLDKARVEGRFDRLAIAAAPKFLGMLREAMPDPLRDKVEEEIDKDLVDLDAGELREKISILL